MHFYTYSDHSFTIGKHISSLQTTTLHRHPVLSIFFSLQFGIKHGRNRVQCVFVCIYTKHTFLLHPVGLRWERKHLEYSTPFLRFLAGLWRCLVLISCTISVIKCTAWEIRQEILKGTRPLPILQRFMTHEMVSANDVFVASVGTARDESCSTSWKCHC